MIMRKMLREKNGTERKEKRKLLIGSEEFTYY
jgi:hypothetical protein